MELTTISEVSKMHQVSTRTLRYYEEIGIMTSTKKEDYAYRVYTEDSILRLQQIIMLRKLGISLSHIKLIFESSDAATTITIFQEKLEDVVNDLYALTTMKVLLKEVIDHLQNSLNISLSNGVIQDEKLFEVLETISLPKKILKEKKIMADFKENQPITTKFDNVRVLHIPPFVVASSHFVGENPEDGAGQRMKDFVLENKLYDIKPELRLFGFNNPNPDEHGNHGYEYWVTIPESFKVKAPMSKKHFAGGLYVAHCIKMGDFHEWQEFAQWLSASKEYEYEAREPLGMHGSLEEHLNAYNYYANSSNNSQFAQLDLLIPIKRK